MSYRERLEQEDVLFQEKRYQRGTVCGSDVAFDDDTGAPISVLDDGKCNWRARKIQAMRLADVWRSIGRNDAADRVIACSTWLEYYANGAGDRTLRHYNACKGRLCPVCGPRMARVRMLRLLRIMDVLKKTCEGCQAIFLTLTVPSAKGPDLRGCLDWVLDAWRKLTNLRPFKRAVHGWFRSVEVTRNATTDMYHPHIHAILVVKNEYFDPSKTIYIPHGVKRQKNTAHWPRPEKNPCPNQSWLAMWASCLGVDHWTPGSGPFFESYYPWVRVSETYGAKKGTDKYRDMKRDWNGVLEAAKYAVKYTEYVDLDLPLAEAASVVSTYETALYRKRLTAMGGCVKKAALAAAIDLEAPADLVHDVGDTGPLTAATAPLIEDYRWHFRFRDYLLRLRYENPDFAGGT